MWGKSNRGLGQNSNSLKDIEVESILKHLASCRQIHECVTKMKGAEGHRVGEGQRLFVGCNIKSHPVCSTPHDLVSLDTNDSISLPHEQSAEETSASMYNTATTWMLSCTLDRTLTDDEGDGRILKFFLPLVVFHYCLLSVSNLWLNSWQNVKKQFPQRNNTFRTSLVVVQIALSCNKNLRGGWTRWARAKKNNLDKKSGFSKRSSSSATQAVVDKTTWC